MPLAQHHQKMKIGPRALGAIFKIDAYDERFLSSSVVTFGARKFAGGFRPIFQDRPPCGWRGPSTLHYHAAAQLAGGSVKSA